MPSFFAIWVPMRCCDSDLSFLQVVVSFELWTCNYWPQIAPGIDAAPQNTDIK
jgi:hypothetical protein